MPTGPKQPNGKQIGPIDALLSAAPIASGERFELDAIWLSLLDLTKTPHCGVERC